MSPRHCIRLFDTISTDNVDSSMIDTNSTVSQFAVMSLSQLFEGYPDKDRPYAENTEHLQHRCVKGLNFLDLPKGRSIAVPSDVA